MSAELSTARAGVAWRRDIVVAVALGAVASFGSYSRSALTQTLLPDGNDVWFESDLPRIVANMSERESNHYRTEVHPLFSLMTTPVVYGVRATFGTSAVHAIRILVAATASTWVVALFILLRLIGVSTFAAAWFAGVGVTSAAAVCWFAIPETFALGSVTIMLALMVTAISSTRRVPAIAYTCSSALTFSVTVTNWMAGLVTTAIGLPARRAIQTTVTALGVVTLAWAVQKIIFPSARFFIRSTHELKYLEPVHLQRLWEVIRSFFVHALILPEYVIVDAGPYRSIPFKLVSQFSPIASEPAALIAVSAWLGLLGIGSFAMVTVRQYPRMRLSLGLIVAGQFGLHLVYGNETFLYSLHWVPLLVLIAALGTHTRARRMTVALAVVAVIAMWVSNTRQFERTAAAAAGIMRSGAESVTP